MRDRYGRELAEYVEFTETGEIKALNYLGSGTTCIAYTTEGPNGKGSIILKEFAPIIFGEPAMKRVEKDGPLSQIEDHAIWSDILERRQARFYGEKVFIENIKKAYDKEINNMLIVPDYIMTSLGKCQWCDKMNGGAFSTILLTERTSNFAKRFINALKWTSKIFYQLNIYHQNGILNADLKSDNIFAIGVDTYDAVRSIDFGSILIIEDVLKTIDEYKARGWSDKRITQEIMQLFASSEPFYTTQRIKETVSFCISDLHQKEEKNAAIQKLDIVAAWKIFLYLLSEDIENEISADIKAMQAEHEIRSRFEKCLANEVLCDNLPLFANYAIYYLLDGINYRVSCTADVQISAKSIYDTLQEIVYIIEGTSEATSKSENMNALSCARNQKLINKAFARQSYLLEERLEKKYSKTIAGVLEFCRDERLNVPEQPGELNYFLLTGHKHK